MSYHANASEAPGSLDAGIAELPGPDRTEATSQQAVIQAMIDGLAELYGFEAFAASINGAHAESWCSVNVMLTKAP